jgi:hypothetical protein
MALSNGIFRTSDKFYTSRPPANCASARLAWDILSKKGPIVRLRLLDGYWGAERENGQWDDVENIFALEKRKAATKDATGFDAKPGERCKPDSTN